MKSINSFLLVAAVVVSQSAFSRGGDRVGNGGNSIASHFSTIARNVHMVWSDICTNQKDPEGYCRYLSDFEGLLSKDSDQYVKVIGEKDPQKVRAYDGEIREAINLTDPNEIIVNEKSWKLMEIKSQGYSRRINLVLHEYLTFIGLDGSDHYDFSAAIYGMLVRKGYDLSKLTRAEGLPTPCSIKVSSSSAKQSKNALVKGLIKKGYLVKNSNEDTRYDIKLTTKCSDQKIVRFCAVHAQMIDHYTNSVAFDQMVISSGILKNKEKTLNKLNDKILNLIPSRSCKTILD